MRGPQPKPTALKLIEGNRGKRPLNANEPRPKAALPACPRHITGEARREWKRVAKALHGCGLLTEIDRAALEAYVTAYGRWLAAEAEVRKRGAIVTTPNGYPQMSPHLSIANRAFEQMVKMLDRFGMTPASRSRISVAPPADPKGKWDGVLD